MQYNDGPVLRLPLHLQRGRTYSLHTGNLLIKGNVFDLIETIFIERQTFQNQPVIVIVEKHNLSYASFFSQSGFPTPWCSTQTDGSGKHVTGNYGDCNESCPMEEG